MYSFTSRVRYSECDEHAQLSLVSLVNYLQDCSTFHTESLGLGIDFMASHHFAWLLAAWQIEVLRLPRFCDDIVVGTWCYDMSRTLAKRNFSICAPDGTPYVRADSLWFTFDTQTQRPCRIPDSERAYLTDEPRMDMPETHRKLEVAGTPRVGTPIVVSEQNLDTNGHVNNAQYVLMAEQAVEDTGHLSAPMRICVQYRMQAHLGDVLVPTVHEQEDTRTVVLADEGGEAYTVVSFAPLAPALALS